MAENNTANILDDLFLQISENLTKFENSSNLSNASELMPNFEDEHRSTYSQSLYIYVYTGLIIAGIVLTTFRSYLFFRICMNASRGLHNTMFNNVLKATMRFFDTNPSGIVLLL